MEDDLDPAALAADLRLVLSRLVRRLRAERTLPLAHGLVLARLEAPQPQSVSDLAAAEHVRPQSMAQTVAELQAAGLVERRPDPGDRRRALVSMTEAGRARLRQERVRREGWLAAAIARELTARERRTLHAVVDVLHRLSES